MTVDGCRCELGDDQERAQSAAEHTGKTHGRMKEGVSGGRGGGKGEEPDHIGNI